MADSLPPSGYRYPTRSNSRKRSLEVDDSPTEKEDECIEKSEEEGASSSRPGELDCAICLQSCVHPTRLPCGHIFCFLCMKGVFRASARCAMCRRPIPRAFLETPDLLEIPASSSATPGEEEAYHWFYEGRHGWWEYDPRANDDLEAAFLAGESKVELLIAGYVYLVDLHGMMQYRKTDPGRRRAVKRDKVGTACKGVAGIRPTVLQAVGDRSRTRSQSSDASNTLVEALNGLTLDDEDLDDLETLNNLIRYHTVAHDEDDEEEEGDDDEPPTYSDDDDDDDDDDEGYD